MEGKTWGTKREKRGGSSNTKERNLGGILKAEHQQQRNQLVFDKEERNTPGKNVSRGKVGKKKKGRTKKR